MYVQKYQANTRLLCHFITFLKSGCDCKIFCEGPFWGAVYETKTKVPGLKRDLPIFGLIVPPVGQEGEALLKVYIWVVFKGCFVIARSSQRLASYLGIPEIKLLMNILRPWRTSGSIMLKKWQVELCARFLLSDPWEMSSEKLKQDQLCYSAVIG